MMINKIREIAEAVGNDKITVMKKYPELKDILRYAYDPFKKYYMTAPELDGLDDPMAADYIPFSMLDDLVTRNISGNAAFELVSDWIVSLNTGMAEVFKMILNKDLRCGINVKTINKAWPDLIPLVFDGSIKPPVMLLKNLDLNKVKYPCLAAVKKDGVRGQFVTAMLSRSGHKLIGHDHIEEQLEKYNHELDGELCIPGEIFDVASGLIRDKNQTPNSVYWIFDIPSMPGTKLERYRYMCNNFNQTDSVKIISHKKIENEYILCKFYNWALRQGEEGIVVYDPYSLYEDKRSYDWMRLVPIKTADCKVTGFVEGKGKHANSLGKILVDYKGHEVGVGTGFKEKVQLNQGVKGSGETLVTLDTLDLASTKYSKILVNSQNIRQYIWDNQELFLGAVAECEFKEETKAGSMRQPRFKRWRWDK